MPHSQQLVRQDQNPVWPSHLQRVPCNGTQVSVVTACYLPGQDRNRTVLFLGVSPLPRPRR